VWPLVTNFVNRDGTVADALVSELPGKKANLALYAVGRGVPGQAVTGFDADRDLWWVDLEIDQGIAYRPFIRLALARYQPHADPTIRLSPISVLDVVQLEPERTATVQVPFNPIGNVQTVRASVTLTGPTYQTNSTGGGVGQAVLILERNDVSDPTNSRADWVETARVNMTASLVSGLGHWSASINVPANRPSGRYRLVIEQSERWRTDGSPSSSFLIARYGQRFVHQDILPI